MTCYEWHLSRLSTYVKPEDHGSCCYFFQVSHTTAMINRRSKRSKETGRKSEREIEREREGRTRKRETKEGESLRQPEMQKLATQGRLGISHFVEAGLVGRMRGHKG